MSFATIFELSASPFPTVPSRHGLGERMRTKDRDLLRSKLTSTFFGFRPGRGGGGGVNFGSLVFIVVLAVVVVVTLEGGPLGGAITRGAGVGWW